MKFGQLLLFALGLFLVGCQGDKTLSESVQRQPNIVLIMTDDQGYGDHLSFQH
jgi:hypothetical protein